MNFCQHKKKIQHGFTLIEIMVVIVVMSIFTFYAVINLNFRKPERQVEKATRELYSMILFVRSLAASGVIFSSVEQSVPNGYGIFFRGAGGASPDSVASYLVFGDLYTSARSKMYDVGDNEQFISVPERMIQEDAVEAMVWEYDDSAGEFVLQGAPSGIFFETQTGEVTFTGAIAPLVASKLVIEVRHVKDAAVRGFVIVDENDQIYTAPVEPGTFSGVW